MDILISNVLLILMLHHAPLSHVSCDSSRRLTNAVGSQIHRVWWKPASSWLSRYS